MHELPVELSVNGRPQKATVEPRVTLRGLSSGERCGLTTAPTWAASTVRAAPARCCWTDRRSAPA